MLIACLCEKERGEYGTHMEKYMSSRKKFSIPARYILFKTVYFIYVLYIIYVYIYIKYSKF